MPRNVNKDFLKAPILLNNSKYVEFSTICVDFTVCVWHWLHSNLVKWGLLDHLLEHVVDPCKKSRRDSQSVAKKAAQNQIKRVVLLRSRG